ncbi:MAG TPA: ABC transporter ATP-binding protein [Polyangia bacterium]|jgi:ABC-2 type transport system ATP-binding protein|nr:ABC transporter ATP-binding protein [Polyangia bacterium]
MIQVEGLTKYYGDHAAIRDLNFTIERGEVVGFLGRNGAGKTTTLRVLGCVLLPTAGRVLIDGVDVQRDPHEIRKRTGFLPDTPPLYDEMTVGDYLAFVAELRGVPGSKVKARVAEVEGQVELRDRHEDPLGSLSHGYRQRVGLAQALVHQPSLLVLDEPTNGLDPVQIVEMRRFIRNLRGTHTVLLSSHILTEISQTCDRILVIEQGEIVFQGTESELADRQGSGGLIEVEVQTPAAKAQAVLQAVQGVRAVRVVREESGVSALRLEAPLELRPQIVRALVAADIDLLRIDRGLLLESTFLQLTKTGAAASADASGKASSSNASSKEGAA